MDLSCDSSNLFCPGSRKQTRRVAYILQGNLVDFWGDHAVSGRRKRIGWNTDGLRYLTFALVLIPFKAVKSELGEHKFTWTQLFSNSVFFTLIVSLLSTYVLWIFISLISLDAWHIVTSVSKFIHPGTTRLTHQVIPILPSLPYVRQYYQYLRIL
jgi:hypothetical protein